MAEVVFVYPLVLLGLLAVPVLALFLIWTERRRAARLRRIGAPGLLAMMVQRVSPGRRSWKAGLWLLSVMFLIVTMARPTWGLRSDIIEVEGASVFVLLDVSNSMNAEDVAPSRLERAKLGVTDLMVGIEGNEVGLVTFAGSAFVFFPLTTDIRSGQAFLNFVTTDTITQQGTAIGEAVELALNSFDETQATERIIVLLSDGEDHGQETEDAIQAAVSAGVPIHVLGYGTDGGGSIPIRNSAGVVVGNKLDRNGEMIITRLDESSLERIARRTGGVYQQIDPSGTAIDNVVRLVNSAQSGSLGEEERTTGIERFALFALLSLLLLSLEMLVPETKSS